MHDSSGPRIRLPISVVKLDDVARRVDSRTQSAECELEYHSRRSRGSRWNSLTPRAIGMPRFQTGKPCRERLRFACPASLCSTARVKDQTHAASGIAVEIKRVRASRKVHIAPWVLWAKGDSVVIHIGGRDAASAIGGEAARNNYRFLIGSVKSSQQECVRRPCWQRPVIASRRASVCIGV